MPTLDEWLQNWTLNKGDTTFGREDNWGLNYTRRPPFYCYVPINMQTWWSVKWHIPPPIFGRQIDITKSNAKQMLESQYKFVGDMGQMTKSICAILIRFTGYVPQQCNCISNIKSLDTNTKLAYNASQYADGHGVKHHGASYNTTMHQDQLIANLTDVDAILYEAGLELFQEQVEQLEHEYNIKLCDSFS